MNVPVFGGIRVVDLTQVLSGPLATRLLGDYGAEVVKVESKERMDPARNFPPLVDGWSGYFETFNRGKKSVCLDLRKQADLEKFYELVKSADVVVENWMPKVKYKLKVDYQTLREINPRLIYASLAGVDQESERKYFDVIAQAESGLMSLSGTPEVPMKIGPAVVDAFAGSQLAFAIAGALFERERNGNGQWVQVSMLGSALNLLEHSLAEVSVRGKDLERVGNQDAAIAPFGVFAVQDGFIALAIGSDALWQVFLNIFSENETLRSELFASNAARLANVRQLQKVLEGLFGSYKKEALLNLFRREGIPSTAIREISEVLSDEYLKRSGAIDWVEVKEGLKCAVPGRAIRFGEEKPAIIKKSPELGEHNEEYGLRDYTLFPEKLGILLVIFSGGFPLQGLLSFIFF